MKVSKYLAIGILGFSTLSATAGNINDFQEKKKNQKSKEALPSAQLNNFARKSIGYNAVINSGSIAANTENRIGDIGIVNNNWMKRKGSIGYNSILTLYKNPELIYGLNSCVNKEGELVKFQELSNRRIITNKWSQRKGSIGYHSINKNIGDPTYCK